MGAATGVWRCEMSTRMPLWRKVDAVETCSSYVMAPPTGRHANDGLRWKDELGASLAVSMNPCRPVGAAMPAVDAPARELATNAARMPRKIVRRAIRFIPMVVGSARDAALPQTGDASSLPAARTRASWPGRAASCTYGGSASAGQP